MFIFLQTRDKTADKSSSHTEGWHSGPACRAPSFRHVRASHVWRKSDIYRHSLHWPPRRRKAQWLKIRYHDFAEFAPTDSVRDCNTDWIMFLSLPFVTASFDSVFKHYKWYKFGRFQFRIAEVQQSHSWERSSCSATQGIPQNKIWNFIAISTGVRRCALAWASLLHPPPDTVSPSPSVFLSFSVCASLYEERKMFCGRCLSWALEDGGVPVLD